MAQSYSRCSKACIEQGSGTGWETKSCMAWECIYPVVCVREYGMHQYSASLTACVRIIHGRYMHVNGNQDKEGGVALITAALL